MGQLQRLGDRLDYGRQHRFGRVRGLQTLPETGDHRVRVVPLAVHQAVHATLQTVPQGREEYGDEARGDERDGEVVLDSEQHAEVAYYQHVKSYDAGGQCTVDEGAVDDEVYVEQAVAQDRNADGERDEQQDYAGGRREYQAGKRSERTGRREDLRREEHAENRYDDRRHGEDDPLRLLTLREAGRASVAVDLRSQ